MTNELNVSVTGWYPIGETARLLGVTRQTILRWCESGQMHYSITRVNGRKKFSGREIRRMYVADL